MKEGESPILVGLGEILWDMLPGGKQLGGAPANFAYHALLLGGQGHVASCVGDDGLGRGILARLDAWGLGRSAVAIDNAHPTGTVTVALNEQGHPDYTIHEDVAYDFIPASNTLMSLAERADAVCFGALAQRAPVSRESIRGFLRRTRDGCLRMFDINLRQSFYTTEVILESLALSDILKLNDGELPVAADLAGVKSEGAGALAEFADRFDLQMVVLTRGERGSILFADGETSELPGEKTKVVDTVGAGDAFTAAVAMGVLGKETLGTIHAKAERLAAYVCSQAGATPGRNETSGN